MAKNKYPCPQEQRFRRTNCPYESKWEDMKRQLGGFVAGFGKKKNARGG